MELIKQLSKPHQNKPQQINVKAEIERKEDANTAITPDMLSKRKPKTSAKNLSAALQAVINPLENTVGIQGQQ